MERVPAAIPDAFAAFLRPSLAEVETSPQAGLSEHAHAGLCVAWCDDGGIDPGGATGATWSLARGANLLSMGQAMGHSSTETTQV